MSKHIIVAAAALLLLATGCTQNNEKKIVGRWQQTSIHNPVMEEIVAEQQAFIDTLGKSTTPAQNDSLYGVQNIDSLREALRQEIKAFKEDQERAIQQTWFEFRKDGILLLKTEDMLDSAGWYLEDDGHTLVLDEMKLKGSGTQVRMEIVTLTDDALKLRFSQGQDTSTVTFKPAKQ